MQNDNWPCLGGGLVIKMLAVAGVTGLISACTVIPGTSMSTPLSARVSQFFNPSTNVARAQLQHLPITVGLIEELRRREAQPVVPKLFRSSGGRYEYTVGASDVLKIHVWEQPGSFQSADDGLQQQVTEVHPDGTIYFPYAGVMRAEGKTTYELRNEITKRLNRVITDPRVDVQVVEYRSKQVLLTGEVGRPGEIALDGHPMTIVRALQLAGGPTQDGWLGGVRLTRKGATVTLDLDRLMKQSRWDWNIRLEHGDVLQVPSYSGRKILVMGGGLGRAKAINAGDGPINLAEAMIEAGGLDERRGDPRGIFVLRNVERRVLGGRAVYFSTVYRLNARRADAYLLATNFTLKPKDVVFITAAPLAKWNNLISLLLPSIFFGERIDDLGS